MSACRIKVLFFAEGATLAHVVRPFALARTLDPARFDVTFCRPPAFRWLTAEAPFLVTDIRCQEVSIFGRRLKYGVPLYDFATLVGYVEDDLALIDSVRPHVIVGDFRLSLSVSSRLRSVPYMTICDAYWSPERSLQPPLPVLGFTRYVPLPAAERIFRCISGLALRLHALPMERLRARYELPSLSFDLRRCYTDADFRLYASFPLLFPEVNTGKDAAFVGPVTWFPGEDDAPDFCDLSKPLIYVTMGSSGDHRLLGRVIPVLEQTSYPIVVATAGKPLSFEPASPGTRVFDYLPGNLVCRFARLVVCNGGSPTTNQALANGVPVLGIAQNMDQFLNMQAIDKYGAGVLMRSDRASEAALRSAVTTLIEDVGYTARAKVLAQSVEAVRAKGALAHGIEALLSRPKAPR